MKKIYLFILCAVSMIKMQAQNFDWAQRGGLWAYDYGYGIVTDNSGNVYAAGKFEMNSVFNSDTLPCQGNHDIWLAQYSSAGSLNWIKTAGGPLGDYAHAIAYDGTSNIAIAGEIEGPHDTIKFSGSPITLVTKSANDAFVAKYDLLGNLIWAKSAGGYQDDKALGVTYDNSGNVYICGYYNDTAWFGSTMILGNIGSNDIFVAKYDANGNFQWVQHAGSSGRDEAKSIKCDALGNVYICGLYSNGCAFGTQTLTCTAGYFDAFVAKYSSSGTLLWAKNAGGNYDDVAWSLTIDNSGKIFVAGEFNAYADFGGIYLTTAGQAQAFVACYDSNGNVSWATAAGSMTQSGAMLTRARGIGCDGNNLFITGQFGGIANFGTHQVTAADSSDIFIASLDNNGNFLKVITVGGLPDSVETLGYESGIAICATSSGMVYATGSTLNGGIFGSTPLAQFGRTDVFITGISLMTGVDDLTNDIRSEDILIYPNPNNGNFTIDLLDLKGQRSEATVFNCLGQKVYNGISTSPKMNIDLSMEGKGIYFIEFKTENNSVSRGKIIIQ